MGIFILRFQGNLWRVLMWGSSVAVFRMNPTMVAKGTEGWQMVEGVGGAQLTEKEVAQDGELLALSR